MSDKTNSTQLAVIGGGPGGYAAAFLAADLGMKVTLIDPEPNPGGVCLYRGCIPSKALLHAARVLTEAREAANWGIQFPEPKIDINKLRAWKDGVVKKLTGGLGQLSKHGHDAMPARALYYLGDIAKQKGDPALAQDYYQGAVEAKPDPYFRTLTEDSLHGRTH